MGSIIKIVHLNEGQSWLVGAKVIKCHGRSWDVMDCQKMTHDLRGVTLPPPTLCLYFQNNFHQNSVKNLIKLIKQTSYIKNFFLLYY